MEFANKELIIITGVSGAGKSSAMGFLEDVGYYCIDNMPPVLLPTFIGLIANREEYRKVAIVVDGYFTILLPIGNQADKGG